MQDNNKHQAASTSTTAPKTGISLVILGVLLSLIIKSALDHAFGGMSHYGSPTEVWLGLRADPYGRMIRLCTLVVFLVTLVRFYLGAHRYAEQTSGTGIHQAVTTVVGTCLLFSGFYVASLVIYTTRLFLAVVVAFHILDFIWFFFAGTLLNVPRAIQALVGMWQVMDAVTIGSIAVLLLVPMSAIWAEGGSLGVLFVIGVIDLYWFRKFYVDEPGWEKNRYIVWKSGSQ